ncbi:MAG TPA: ABC transporter permease, partial [Vicinamibacterales bacterium]|nr:ABC transporter permease [Vicinamibacterales bacterium]
MTSSGAARWLISVVAWLVPSDMRREWRREWEAELDWCAAEGRGTWHQLRRARGAGRHALWLRSRRWRTGMLWQDIRYGARALRSRPALTVVAILTLALGIGANTAIFSVVHAVLLRDLPYPDTEQLVSIYATHRRYDFDHGVERPEDIQYWIEHAQTTSVIAPIDGGLITVTTGGQPDRIRYSQVPPQFFEAMKVAPMLGRVFSGAEATANERVVVVSHALWSSRLGGSSDLSTMTIDLDGQAWRVIGVMPPAFKFPVEIPLWLPFDLSRTEKSWHLGSVARLKPGVTIPDAQRDFDRMAADLERQNPKARKDRGFNVVGLQADLARRSVDGLAFLQGVVGLVLLIGCANVANLMLAQASARQREFSVRSALGASRLRLIRQLMTESLLLSMAGAAVGIAIAIPGVRALVHAAPPVLLPYPDELGVNWTVLSFTVVLAAATGLIFGLAPALMSSTPNLTRTLGQGVRTASTGLSLSRRQYFRGGLVALEMALALVLLVGGGLLIRSFAMLSSQPPGFESSGLLTAQISLPPARYATSEARRAFWSRLLSDLSAVPGVSQAVMSNALPFSTWEWQLDFKVEGRADVPNDGAGF